MTNKRTEQDGRWFTEHEALDITARARNWRPLREQEDGPELIADGGFPATAIAAEWGPRGQPGLVVVSGAYLHILSGNEPEDTFRFAPGGRLESSSFPEVWTR